MVGLRMRLVRVAVAVPSLDGRAASRCTSNNEGYYKQDNEDYHYIRYPPPTDRPLGL